MRNKLLAGGMALLIGTSIISGTAFASEPVVITFGTSSQTEAEEVNDVEEIQEDLEDGDPVVLEDVPFVMIYNPLVYTEENELGYPDPAKLSTGDFSTQIVTGLNRASGLEAEAPMYYGMSQRELAEGMDASTAQRESGRAGGMDPVYEKGDTHTFYRYDTGMRFRTPSEFECLFEGESCYVWGTEGSITEEQAEFLGTEFDENIFQKDTEAFGVGRFTENGGKVNLLCYEFQDYVLGFFTIYDIFSSTEYTAEEARGYTLNTDHAIININSKYMGEDMLADVGSTAAHEYQHQICASDCFYYEETPLMETWLNEAMSAYAEELTYPGSKNEAGYNQCFYLSDNFRCGQSLYNFDTDGDDYIGAYGSVYLFEEYLRKMTGDDVFYAIHDFWRNSYTADVRESDALAACVGEDAIEKIDAAYEYPETIEKQFATEEEEWMSKMTLDYFIETLQPELAGLEGYENGMHLYTLYDQVNPVQIEGGGRIVVATKGNRYEVPKNADKGLIYVGLNEDFEPVEFVVK